MNLIEALEQEFGQIITGLKASADSKVQIVLFESLRKDQPICFVGTLGLSNRAFEQSEGSLLRFELYMELGRMGTFYNFKADIVRIVQRQAVQVSAIHNALSTNFIDSHSNMVRS